MEQLWDDGEGGEATQEQCDSARVLLSTCPGHSTESAGGLCPSGPLRVLSSSDYFWLGASQPQENMELCLELSKCSQGLGMVLPAAKAGVHRGLLVTRTGYYFPFSGPTKGKKRP